MAYIKKSELKSITESIIGSRVFSTVLNEVKMTSQSNARTSVFLSHSHSDLSTTQLDQILVMLGKAGVAVYIDSKDAEMPPFTNAETAKRIKAAIKDKKKFILAATNNAINSKWCNWELGFADPHKYIDHIALIPLVEDSGTWPGAEYLNIYPRIEKINGSLTVIYPDNTMKTLKVWLES